MILENEVEEVERGVRAILGLRRGETPHLVERGIALLRLRGDRPHPGEGEMTIHRPPRRDEMIRLHLRLADVWNLHAHAVILHLEDAYLHLEDDRLPLGDDRPLREEGMMIDHLVGM